MADEIMTPEQLIAFFSEPEIVPPEPTLPNPGDVFLMPLENGMFGVCRVLRHNGTKQRKRQGAPMVLAAASAWIGMETPDINDPRLREILILSHHAYAARSDDRREILWLSDPVPETFQWIGTLPPTAEEENMEWFTYSGWTSFPYQLYSQWRWDHEREAVLREDAEQEAWRNQQIALRKQEALERKEQSKRKKETDGDGK